MNADPVILPGKTNISNENEFSEDPFKLISSEQLSIAIHILKNRLPRSAHVYNSAMVTRQFPDFLGYSLNGDLSENAVIVFIYFREDFGHELNISVPLDFDYKTSDNVKAAFINTSIIDWNMKYTFGALDRLISPMIIEISTIHKANSTLVVPMLYHYMSQEESAALDIKPEVGVEVKSIDFEQGLKLLLKGWKYTREGTEDYVKLLIENEMSSGVYINGKPASGLIANKNGLLGMLITDKSYRGRGYALMCMKHILRQMGMKGLVGVSAIECKNVASIKFHEKLGMTVSHICDDIIYEKSGFESK